MYGIPHHHYNHLPNTSNADRFPQTNIQSIKVARDNLAAAEVSKLNAVGNEHMNAEQMAYKLYPYLCTNEYLTYCGDPFNKEACSNILGHFSFVSKNDENLHLSLPYTNSCSSLLSDPTDNNQLTTWAINAIWFLPQNIHYLYAEKGNRPLS